MAKSRKSKKSKSYPKVSKSVRRTQPPIRASRRLYDHVDLYDLYASAFQKFPIRNGKKINVRPRTPEPTSFEVRPQKLGKFHAPFTIPKKLDICGKRMVRREVLHATGKAGSRVRPPKYTAKSAVKC